MARSPRPQSRTRGRPRRTPATARVVRHRCRSLRARPRRARTPRGRRRVPCMLRPKRRRPPTPRLQAPGRRGRTAPRTAPSPGSSRSRPATTATTSPARRAHGAPLRRRNGWLGSGQARWQTASKGRAATLSATGHPSTRPDHRPSTDAGPASRDPDIARRSACTGSDAVPSPSRRTTSARRRTRPHAGAAAPTHRRRRRCDSRCPGGGRPAMGHCGDRGRSLQRDRAPRRDRTPSTCRCRRDSCPPARRRGAAARRPWPVRRGSCWH